MTQAEKLITYLTKVAEQTPDGIVDGVDQQSIRDAIALIREQQKRVKELEDYISTFIVKTDCFCCSHWDGDDGLCHNPESEHFMRETDGGCEKKEG